MIVRRRSRLAVAYWITYATWNWHCLDPRTSLPFVPRAPPSRSVAPRPAPAIRVPAHLRRERIDRATRASHRPAMGARNFVFWTAALTLQAIIQPALAAGPVDFLRAPAIDQNQAAVKGAAAAPAFSARAFPAPETACRLRLRRPNASRRSRIRAASRRSGPSARQ
jgi:hypothetical protein